MPQFICQFASKCRLRLFTAVSRKISVSRSVAWYFLDFIDDFIVHDCDQRALHQQRTMERHRQRMLPFACDFSRNVATRRWKSTLPNCRWAIDGGVSKVCQSRQRLAVCVNRISRWFGDVAAAAAVANVGSGSQRWENVLINYNGMS